MLISLKYTAVLKVQGARNGSTLELPDGATVADLLDLLAIAREHQRYVAPIINGQRKELTHRLAEADQVYLALPVGGG